MKRFTAIRIRGVPFFGFCDSDSDPDPDPEHRALKVLSSFQSPLVSGSVSKSNMDCEIRRSGYAGGVT